MATSVQSRQLGLPSLPAAAAAAAVHSSPGGGALPSFVDGGGRMEDGCSAAAAHSKWTAVRWVLQKAATDGGVNRRWGMWRSRSRRRWGRRGVRGDQRRAAWGMEKGSGGAPIWIWTGLGPAWRRAVACGTGK